MNKIESIVNTFRPKTLSASFVPVVVGTLMVPYQNINWLVALSLLMTAICLQMGTNLINDAIDHKKGADQSDRTGPIRALQAGVLTQKTTYQLGLFFFALTFLTAWPFLQYGGPYFGLLLAISIIAGYCYTGGPYPLAYLGFGELFVFIFFGLVATVSATYFQTHQASFMVWITGAEIGLLASVMISINNLRDLETDKRASKMTLAARFGESFARAKITLLLFVPYMLNLLWFSKGKWLLGALPFLAFPVAINIYKGITRHPAGPIYNKYLAEAGLHQLAFGMLLCLGAQWG